jgi:nicotinamide-nucleotide amidase
MLPDLIRRGRDPLVGITVHGATITLRITANGYSPEECYRAMEPTVATIHECLGELIFGEGDDELEHAVARMLAERKQTLATAEWGSGGMIADWLSATSLANDCFLGGIVIRNAAACRQLLAVEGHDLAAVAQACRAKFDADYGLVVGALPAVDPQSQEPPLLHFAVADRHAVTIKSAPYSGHPDILKTRGAKQALNLLRLTLLRAKF